MRRRTRKLLGAILMIGFVLFYGMAAMALAEARSVQAAPPLAQTLIYAVLGLCWILPLMPLITWMERPDTPTPAVRD